MITTGIGFLAFIVAFTALVLYLAKRFPLKLYKFFPPILIIYVGTMLFFTFGMWTITDEVKAVKTALVDIMVPAMVFLMCLSCNVKKILKLGPKLLLTFCAATITICIGFVASFAIFGGALGHPADAFGAVCASWVGGIQNFLAVKNSLAVDDGIMSNIILMININYSFWIMILVAIGNFAGRFNKWAKADVSGIESIAKTLDGPAAEKKPFDHLNILVVLGVSLVAVYVCRLLAGAMPDIGFINASVWEYIFISIAGLALGLTKMSDLPGSEEVSNVMLMLVMTLLATEINILQIADAWLFIIAGAVVLIVHTLLMLPLAKLFHLDLHSCGVASIANIGGPSSAPIVAATYGKSYVSISVLMGTLGCVIGTFVGLGVAQILHVF